MHCSGFAFIYLASISYHEPACNPLWRLDEAPGKGAKAQKSADWHPVPRSAFVSNSIHNGGKM